MKRTRLLLVDDHALVRAGIRALLENGEQVDVVGESGDGLHALALMAELRPDVALIDLTMPGLNGFEVLKTLSSQGAKCAIVLMSGSDDRLARAEIMANQLGLRLIGVLHKPFRLADLHGILGAKP